MDRSWRSGDLDAIARDEANEGAADVGYYRLQRERDEAHVRAERWEKLAAHWRTVACGLLCEPVRVSSDVDCESLGVPTWAVARAVVYARCAARVSEWARQARERSR
jgi:hypothetical protein